MRLSNLINRILCIAVVAISIVACTSPATEVYQGPEKDKSKYGPQPQVYELPEVSGSIYYAAPDGQEEADGKSLEKPTTIDAAIERAQTGGAIIMRGGTYRTGDLLLNQGIIIQPYRDEKPIFNGTRVAENWSKVNDKLWVTGWETLFPGKPESWWNREKEEKFTPLHLFNNDGIFIDGQYLQSVGVRDSVTSDTYFVDYDKREIYIGTDPAGKNIEITAFRQALRRITGNIHGRKSDDKGPVLKGLTFTQYPDTMVHIEGYYPQGISPEKDNGKDVVGTVFDNCTFAKCFRIAVFAIGDSMVMRHCKIEDSNTEGLYIVASSDVLLEWNIFTNNNIEHWTGFFPSAVKIFNQTHRVVCKNNLIFNHPYSNGLWYDVGNRDGVFVNNWIEKVGDLERYRQDERLWASYSGFFYEISSDAVCAGNVFVNNAQGLLVLNSSNVDICNNTFINSTASFGRNERGDETDHFGWHIKTGPAVDARFNHTFKNNLIYMEKEFFRPAMHAWQPAVMCERLNKPQLSDMNNNLYLVEGSEPKASLINWSPAANDTCSLLINEPAALTALYPAFETGSMLLNEQSKSVFADFSGMDYKLLPSARKAVKPTLLNERTAKAMGTESAEISYIGAYK